MIKNVIFDIGGVIVKFKKETYLDPLGLDEATKNYLIDEILFTDDWFQLSIGKMTDEQFLSNVQKNHPDYFELTKSVFEIETLKQLLPVYSQTIELIKQIKEKPSKRWDAVVDKIILAIITGLMAYIFMRLGLS